MTQTRLPFELDVRAEAGALTAHGGVPLLIEAFRTSGAAALVDASVVIKRRQRGLTPSQLVEGLFSLWAAGGERCEDLAPLREDAALALLLGHGLPAPQTAHDFLDAFDQGVPPLWQGERCHVQGEGERLQGLAKASRRLIAFLQERRPQAVATIDIDATILESQKRAAWPTYDGRTGYQPVVALWAEQDVILADEFRDGNVPAGSGNRRVVEQALAALPAGVDQVRLRGDSSLYEQALLRWLDGKGIGYAISADMSRELVATIRVLPETAWRPESEDAHAMRHWAEVAYVPSDGVAAKDRPAPPRYLTIRITKKQGELFADGKLLVDLSETSTQGRSFRFGEHIYRLHLGTEDQDPDPVIEMHEGARNVPAYRGLVYVTFDELPLRDFGNRIPNITAEIVASGSNVHPSQHVDLPSQGVGNWAKADWLIDPERPYIYNLFGGWLLKLDRVSGQVVYRHDISSDPAVVAWWDAQGWQGGPGPLGYAVDPVSGDLFIALVGSSRTTWTRFDPDTLQIKSWYRQGLFTPGSMLVYAGRYLAAKSALSGALVIIDFGNPIGPPVELASVSYGSRGQGLALDPERARLYVLTKSNTGSEGWVSWVDAGYVKHGAWHLENDLGLPAGSAPSGITYDRASDRVIIGASTGLFGCDPKTLELQDSLLGSYSGGGFVDTWANQATVDGELWLAEGDTIHRIDTVALAPIDRWNAYSLHGVQIDSGIHDPLTDAIWTSQSGVWKLWFDRAGPGTTTLGGIVTELCGRAGLEPADLDTSELDQEVRGYMVPRPVAVREALEKLQQAWLFDVVESDWTLAFRKRERDPVLTIGDASLAAHQPGSRRPPKLLETRAQEAELPRRVTVRYIARENDYQTAAQQAQLIQDLYETRAELVLELPVVLTDDEAKRAAWAILASAWVERDGFELFLPPSFLALDPGDVVEVERVGETPTATLRLRLTEIDLSGGWLLRLKGVADDPIVWQTSHAIGAPTPASQQTGIPFEVPSEGFFLNLPALSAEDGQTGAFWLGVAPAWSLDNATWRGAVVYRSGDGVTFTDYTALTTAMAWAKARSVLPAYERWGDWDTLNVLDVLVQSPGLQFESRTELEVLDGANLLLVGQEIVQFVDAEQLSASEWRLSKLLRGRRGTEWAMGTHQVGEAVLVLDPATFTRVSSLDEVGLARFYRAVSIGSDPSLPEAVGFTNDAASLKPYPPVHIRGSRNGAGDLTIAWTRRTRFGGEWRDLVDAPLNEASEAYEVDVLDGTGAVVRTLASATQSVTYTAADQTTDFGAPQSAIEVAVHQISAVVGRGFAGRATL